MAGNISGGMTWADLWDSTPDKPLPASVAEDTMKGEDGCKRKQQGGKKAKAGPLQWVKALCQKKSHK
ncbi:unnamed protein product [Spirodela intermedia]|uniref:Uncharacterized protein n=2 Tax=Spirodela intermedia TaxID=51605 RepID=A0A7I8JD19_SPIIN|nr:unnamed protein product [Spirodela intermedia]CAA6668040.1 unnamed protein product [Spirodela intermedia]CAA7404868.1 unnamed protein product [Spirodela intermedia]